MDISNYLCVKQPQIRYNVCHVHQKQKVWDSVGFCATKGSKKYEMGRSELQCKHSRLGKLIRGTSGVGCTSPCLHYESGPFTLWWLTAMQELWGDLSIPHRRRPEDERVRSGKVEQMGFQEDFRINPSHCIAFLKLLISSPFLHSCLSRGHETVNKIHSLPVG